MPFVSEAQRKFMYARHPGIAKRWEKHTHEGALPKYSQTESAKNARKRERDEGLTMLQKLARRT